MLFYIKYANKALYRFFAKKIAPQSGSYAGPNGPALRSGGRRPDPGQAKRSPQGRADLRAAQHSGGRPSQRLAGRGPQIIGIQQINSSPTLFLRAKAYRHLLHKFFVFLLHFFRVQALWHIVLTQKSHHFRGLKTIGEFTYVLGNKVK